MNAVTWNALICELPQPHILQSWEWGQFKSRYGWTPDYLIWREQDGKRFAATLALKRSSAIGKIELPLRVIYFPKGPLLDWSNLDTVEWTLDKIEQYGKSAGATFIKIDPDFALGSGLPGHEDALENPDSQAITELLTTHRWHFSNEQIQYRNTVVLDLQPDEELLLARMKSKTRYNIRLAARKGVQVRLGGLEDLPGLYRLYAETSIRDGFTIRSQSYYSDLWSSFFKAGIAKPLLAEVDGTIVAGLILFIFGEKAWYLYGMSADQQRERMPNYLLQWEAIRLAKRSGCTEYDLWGAPDTFTENDPLWNVYRFKEGLGGKVLRHIGAWDLPLKPRIYWLYTRILPNILEIMRRRGMQQTQQSIGL